MLLRALMVMLYLLHCLRQRVKPWLFFQLNADYFNETKGIFSKLDIDRFIPATWRLNQFRDTGIEQPESFPVFVKPEWGQNSVGIRRAGSQVQLDQIRAQRPAGNVPYLIQEAASGSREFEVYIIPGDMEEDFSVLSVTEAINLSGEKLPVNSINNRETRYWDMTGELSEEQQQTLWQNLRSVGKFRMARFGIRANSLDELMSGHFHIFEINLFLPMPLVLLSDNVSLARKISIMNNVTARLAYVTGTVPETGSRKSVFFRKLKVHRENRAAVTKSPVHEGA
ncbi:hypothetical protein M3P05_10310 [Sansalvadorimonas sp. 2012CJ34-2]|uniref:ATP-grasp domain-containing protein n=1 Tax=Parendozoicomonas callyspongiae TaxID=2942213 RepID=A0ABT0PG02_9GAMM|nr:hypothetical protein [Sansalvadorimonas sp. 2012CJ34-2]MCL6270312.1 hypothetical protein [Sansalvadorimonas sp. 2012CJ34-2]